MLALGFANWTFWELYDPAAGIFGPQKVTFDGPNKLILINDGETEIDFRTDIYSNWKEWLLIDEQVNSEFLQALSVVGGDPLPGARILGSTFFLENGWRIKSWQGDHILTITGNVFTREGADPVLPSDGDVSVTVNLNTSTLVEGGRSVGAELGIDSVIQLDEVWKIHGLDATNPLNVTSTSRNAAYIEQTITDNGGGDVTVTRTDT
jgi:hypothetical protein